MLKHTDGHAHRHAYVDRDGRGRGYCREAIEIEMEIEKCVGNLYAAFYQLRKAGKYQEEYDNMGSLIAMLQEDRMVLRHKYNIGTVPKL